MRRSRTITLVLIGSATLSACAPEVAPNYQRDHYTSIEECAADWGRPQDCEPSPGSPYGGGSGYFFRGPMYMPGFRDDAQFAAREQARQEGVAIADGRLSNRAVGTSGSRSGSTQRGGFGSSSRFSSGG